MSVLAEQERQKLAATVQHPAVDSPAHPTDVSETLACRSFSSSSRPTTSRTKRRRRRGMVGSYSLTEIERQAASGELSGRSLSVQAVRGDNRVSLQQQHCKSDSSFNYESNISEMENSAPRSVQRLYRASRFTGTAKGLMAKARSCGGRRHPCGCSDDRARHQYAAQARCQRGSPNRRET